MFEREICLPSLCIKRESRVTRVYLDLGDDLRGTNVLQNCGWPVCANNCHTINYFFVTSWHFRNLRLEMARFRGIAVWKGQLPANSKCRVKSPWFVSSGTGTRICILFKFFLNDKPDYQKDVNERFLDFFFPFSLSQTWLARKILQNTVVIWTHPQFWQSLKLEKYLWFLQSGTNFQLHLFKNFIHTGQVRHVF